MGFDLDPEFHKSLRSAQNNGGKVMNAKPSKRLSVVSVMYSFEEGWGDEQCQSPNYEPSSLSVSVRRFQVLLLTVMDELDKDELNLDKVEAWTIYLGAKEKKKLIIGLALGWNYLPTYVILLRTFSSQSLIMNKWVRLQFKCFYALLSLPKLTYLFQRHLFWPR